MKAFWAFLTGLVVKWFLWAVGQKPKVTDAEGPGEEEKAFDEEIKKEGWCLFWGRTVHIYDSINYMDIPKVAEMNAHEDIHDLEKAYNYLHAALSLKSPLAKDSFIKMRSLISRMLVTI
jgi:tRNA splicing ligase